VQVPTVTSRRYSSDPVTPLEPVDFYNAVNLIEVNQLEGNRVLAHPADIRDLYSWDINVTGFEFKDEIMGGKKVTGFGEFQIQKSIIIPQGEIFLTAEPDFVGVMPVMYSLDVEENHQVEQFYKGWVMDELIGMIILERTRYRPYPQGRIHCRSHQARHHGLK
jgi:hypothetical protein